MAQVTRTVFRPSFEVDAGASVRPAGRRGDRHEPCVRLLTRPGSGLQHVHASRCNWCESPVGSIGAGGSQSGPQRVRTRSAFRPDHHRHGRLVLVWESFPGVEVLLEIGECGWHSLSCRHGRASLGTSRHPKIGTDRPCRPALRHGHGLARTYDRWTLIGGPAELRSDGAGVASSPAPACTNGRQFGHQGTKDRW